MNKAQIAKSQSAKILSIRLVAGNDCAICPVCCNKPGNPFRAFDKSGRVINGCVDATHTGHLVPISESQRWHMRPAAIDIRRMQLSCIGGLKLQK